VYVIHSLQGSAKQRLVTRFGKSVEFASGLKGAIKVKKICISNSPSPSYHKRGDLLLLT